MLFRELQNVKVQGQYYLVADVQHGPGLFTGKYYEMITDFFKMRLYE
jgi:hypothetical protein